MSNSRFGIRTQPVAGRKLRLLLGHATCHRIGQDKSVLATRLIVRGTIEEKVLALQNEKRSLVDNLMGEDQGVFSRMNPDEIMDLFTS